MNKGRLRALLAIVLTAHLGIISYVALDIFDIAPGFLTREPLDASTEISVRMTPHTPETAAVQFAAGQSSNQPDPKSKIAAAAAAPGLGDTRIIVRDALSGEVLLNRGADEAHPIASNTKLLSAVVIAHSMPLYERLTTSTQIAPNGHVVLTAGGDMMLGSDENQPRQVRGHAGIGTLARKTAKALKAQNRTAITLDLDLSYAPGPGLPEGWSNQDLQAGYVGKVTMIGMERNLATSSTASISDPSEAAWNAFSAQLRSQGITVKTGEIIHEKQSGTLLAAVHSSPTIDVLGYALQTSDNALITSLLRQAAAKNGVRDEGNSLQEWTVSRLQELGLPTDNLHLSDAAGLADGSEIPLTLVAEILVRGSSGQDKQFHAVLERMPVAGLSGTLSTRFSQPAAQAARGNVRAKTGTLIGVSLFREQFTPVLGAYWSLRYVLVDRR